MGDVFTVLPLAFVLAMTPVAPSPIPVPGPTAGSPLKEIGRVHATTPFCRTAVEHTLTGITVALDNDVRLAQATQTMRQVQTDSSPIARNNGLQALVADYVALRDATLGGRRAVQQLKRQAKDASTEEQKTALLALANALDGALSRQKLLGDAVGRFALYTDSHEPIEDGQLARMLIDPSRPGRQVTFPRVIRGPVAVAPSQIWTGPKHDIQEIEDNAPRVASDEQTAADRIDAAFSRC